MGREVELAAHTAKLDGIIHTPQRQKTLLQTANKLQSYGYPFVPRLEKRNLKLLILWFVDHCPKLFECSSITDLFAPQPQLGNVIDLPWSEDNWDFDSEDSWT
jgi:hypothetical protein